MVSALAQALDESQTETDYIKSVSAYYALDAVGT
jgi:hypothetical protein